MKIEEAKKLDMVDYLSSLGHQPQRTSNGQYWYHSPLHADKTPSFKINRKLNKWYDFSDGKGGNLIDFGVAYFKISVKDFLHQLGSSSSLSQVTNHSTPKHSTNNEDAIKITRVQSIRSLPLLRYLHERRIPPQIADKYLKEVNYSLRDKNYYALGFPNDAGGYELRNQYMKGSSSPKSSTNITLPNSHMVDPSGENKPSLAVFEGFMDFLSYLSLSLATGRIKDFLVLNSLSFFDKQMPRMQSFEKVHLFLDNDAAGNKVTASAIAIDPQKFKDERKLYQHYSDLNEWCQQQGKSNKHQQRI